MDGGGSRAERGWRLGTGGQVRDQLILATPADVTTSLANQARQGLSSSSPFGGLSASG